MVLYAQLNAENVDRIIREQMEYFEKVGQNFEWKYFEHDTPNDLKNCLIAHGFVPEEAEALMVLDLNEAPEVLLRPITRDVRRITDPSQLHEVVAIQNQVWGEDHSWLGDKLARELQSDPNHLSIYLAYADGKPVSCAWLRLPIVSQFASLWGGSTLPTYRNRGFYTALLATRVQEARRQGVRFLTIDALPMSRTIVEKFGFQLLTYTYACKWKVKNSPTKSR